MFRNFSETLKSGLKKISTLAKGGFFHVLGGNTLSKAIAFLSSIVVVRLISKEEYGYLSFANNLFNYISLISGFGLSLALLKYCSSSNDDQSDYAYLGLALRWGLILQGLLAGAVLFYAHFADIPFPQALPLVDILVVMPLCSFGFQAFLNFLRARNRLKLYASASFIHTAVTLFFSVIFLLVFGLPGALYGRYVAYTGILIFLGIIIWRESPNGPGVILTWSQKKGFFAMGIGLAIGTFFSLIMPLNELFLVNNILRDEVATADYRIAVTFPSQLNLITSSVMVYYFPILSKERDNLRLRTSIMSIFRINGVIVLGIVTLGILLTPILITIVYGGRYSDTSGLMRLFWLAYGVNSLVRIIPMSTLPALGRVKFLMISSVITSILHLGFDALVLRFRGLEWLPYATMASYLIGAILLWLYLRFLLSTDQSANLSIQHPTSEEIQ